MYVNQGVLGKLMPILDTGSVASALSGSLAGSDGDRLAEFVCVGERVEVVRIAVAIATATVSTGSILITVVNRPTAKSATGQVTIGTITIPTGVAAGKVYYKDVNQASIAPGGSLCFIVTTAAAGGSKAGAGIPGFVAQEDPEYKLNESNMVASA